MVIRSISFISRKHNEFDLYTCFHLIEGSVKSSCPQAFERTSCPQESVKPSCQQASGRTSCRQGSVKPSCQQASENASFRCDQKLAFQKLVDKLFLGF
ncbi:hypothetical protein Y032_0672g1381 [Ancylostoma ceylanicum]|uniref:Uncharacterized protein n=1 Tax=Ancylostoma ceylanicum TaxID=53326 RepID=A0A016WJI0_9BILA|nr:hypothetical protein Y032_0672g1381 [Ancylostoma ceylanicum]